MKTRENPFQIPVFGGDGYGTKVVTPADADRVEALEKRIRAIEISLERAFEVIEGLVIDRPTTPEPENIYTPYLDEDGDFCLQDVNCSEHFLEAQISAERIRERPEQYKAFVEFVGKALSPTASNHQRKPSWVS